MNTDRISMPKWMDGLVAALGENKWSNEINNVFNDYVSQGILQCVVDGRYSGEGFIFDVMTAGVKSDVVLRDYPDVVFVQNIRIRGGFIQIVYAQSDAPLFEGHISQSQYSDKPVKDLFEKNYGKDVLFDKFCQLFDNDEKEFRRFCSQFSVNNPYKGMDTKFRISDVEFDITNERSCINPFSESAQRDLSRCIGGMRRILATQTEINVYCRFHPEGYISLSSCVIRGDYGDSDGFGMEDDIDMAAYMNPIKRRITPFTSDKSTNCNLFRYMMICNLSMDDIKKSGLTDIRTEDYYSLGYFPAKRNGYWGVVDSFLNVLIPFDYEAVYIFSNATAKVETKGIKTGVVDMHHRVIIPPKYRFHEIRYMNDSDGLYSGCRMGHYRVRSEWLDMVLDTDGNFEKK